MSCVEVVERAAERDDGVVREYSGCLRLPRYCGCRV